MGKNAKMKYKIINKYVNGLPKYSYENGAGRPTTVVLHDTGNDRSNINGEIAWMSRNYNNAFVHAWADADYIYETADTNFLCWGAGPSINRKALQIELVHEHTKDRFLKSLDRWIFWSAYQCYYYNIVPSDATDGSGTIWTHEAVSKHLGGTDHVDPMPYIRSRGADFGLNISWSQIYNKLVEYYNALNKGDSTKVKMIGEGGNIEAPKPSIKKDTKGINFSKNYSRNEKPYFKGTIDNLGAEVRNRKGSRKTGFNWNSKAGLTLKANEEVYIFEVHNGWCRIYTSNVKGQGSNRWIWNERINITKVY